MDKLDGQSMNIVNENIEKLKEIFPEVFSEDKIDFEKLQEELGNFRETDNERYNFTWNGKQEAKKIAQTPSTGTLRPCKEESKNFDTTQNLYIEGDNLEVLKLLQKSYHKKVKMIYIDPPYNTGKDFVYKDNFKDNIKNYLEVTGQVDSDGNKLSTNSDISGRYHSDWLSMMYPRLKLARNLLKDDGVIFLSIDHNEVSNLRKLCDEIFGEDNFISEFVRITKKAGKSSEDIARNNDTILCYQKTNELYLNGFEHDDDGFKFSDEFQEERGLYKLNQTLDYGSIQYSPSLDYEIELEGKVLRAGNVTFDEMISRRKRNPKTDYCWRWSKDLFEFGLKNKFIVLKNYDGYSRIYTKTYQNVTISKNGTSYFIEKKIRKKPVSTLDFIDNKYSNDNSKKDLMKLFDKAIFDYSKPVELLKVLTHLGTNKNDIVLDFFSGSSTTAHSVMKINNEDTLNRKFIMVQLPEETNNKEFPTICEIGKERIRRAGDRIIEESGNTDLDIGFKVLKLDSSNIKEWDSDFDNLAENLLDSVDNIKTDRTSEDLLYEILLKYGLDLTLPIEEKIINDKKVFIIGFGALVVCLDEDINIEVVEKIAEIKEEYETEVMRVVFKDSSFKDAVVKTNAIQVLKQFNIDEVVSI